MYLGFTRQELTYSYENKQQLEQFLLFNNVGDYSIYQAEKIITYKINQQYAINLNDLVYYVKKQILSFNVPQFFNLIEKLIKKHKNIQENNIKFEYIDINRVWLKLAPGSELFDLRDKQVMYEIVFVGFQCPFYEVDNYNYKKSNVYELIIYLISDFMKYVVNFNQFEDYLNQNKLLDQIQQSCEKQDKQKIQDIINQFFKDLPLIKQNVFIYLMNCMSNKNDDQLKIIQAQTQKAVYEIFETIKVKEAFNKILRFLIPHIIQNQSSNVNKIIITDEMKNQKIQEYQNAKCAKSNQLIEDYINQKIDTMNEELKKTIAFEIDLIKIKKDCFNYISNLRLLNYFFNNPHWMDQYEAFIKLNFELQKKIIDPEINIYFKGEFEICLLKFLTELI